MESHMDPSVVYGEVHEEGHGSGLPSKEAVDILPVVTIEEVLLEPPHVSCLNTHYLEDLGDLEGEDEVQFFCSQDTVGNQEQPISLGC
jgi:hypothetical protein